MRICDHPECQEVGQYRAPKSREALDDYYYFCLQHVRIYNKNWNYYDGMSASQIEAERDADIIGHRPLWDISLGKRVRTELDELMGGENKVDIYANYDEKTGQALKLLQVSEPITLTSIKAHYKEWVKKLHPDSQASSSCENSQNKLKEINQAYAVLKLAFAEDSA